MGVIQRQTIKGSLVNFFGVFLGAISTLFIYPLNWELYGTIQYWIATAVLLTPILRQGSTSIINRFYPYFKSNNIKGFLGFVFIVTGISITATTILVIIASIVYSFINKSEINEIINNNSIFIYCLTILMIVNNILRLHSANAKRITIPNIIKNNGLKVTIIIIVVLSYYNIFDQEKAKTILIIFNLLSVLILFIYLKKLKFLDLSGFNKSSLDKSIKKEMFRYWYFGGLNYLGVILAYKIDTFMIGNMLEKQNVGYYSTFLFLCNMMIIPMTAINEISSPQISSYFNSNKIQKIDELYKKSTQNLLTVGVLIFMLIWFNIRNITSIMTNGQELIPFINLIIFIGISKIFDLSTSINNLIIVHSKWYRINLLFLLLMAILNLSLNYVLISKYGILGAGIATTISILIFNAIKSIFIYKKLKIQPFNKKSGYLYLITILVLVLGPVIENIKIINDWVSLIVIGSISSLIYLVAVYFLKISPQLNKLVDRKLIFK